MPKIQEPAEDEDLSITFTCPKSLGERLDAYAGRKMTGRSTILRQWIQECLEKYDTNTKPTK